MVVFLAVVRGPVRSVQTCLDLGMPIWDVFQEARVVAGRFCLPLPYILAVLQNSRISNPNRGGDGLRSIQRPSFKNQQRIIYREPAIFWYFKPVSKRNISEPCNWVG
ncbi:MAG: hypothetical protein EBT48_05335 [Verrucomicrobia bacterium]|nr:hypothetical protein [Verrucomicrobiota bacterium]